MSAAAEALRRRFGSRTPGLLGARHEYAVLCPFLDLPEGLHLLFEVRAQGLRQGGEVCFPGGRLESGESPAACALRETEEELSIPREEIQLLGPADFVCSQAGFLLRPYVGLVSPAGLAALSPSPAEVAETFSVPFSFFQETAPEVYTYDLTPQPPAGFPYEEVGIPADYPWARGRVDVPIWYWQGHAIWGMTARIVRDLAKRDGK